MIDLEELGRQFDDCFKNETPETFEHWITQRREKMLQKEKVEGELSIAKFDGWVEKNNGLWVHEDERHAHLAPVSKIFSEEQVKESIIIFSKLYPQIEEEVFNEFYDANNYSPTEYEANFLFDEAWEKTFKQVLKHIESL